MADQSELRSHLLYTVAFGGLYMSDEDTRVDVSKKGCAVILARVYVKVACETSGWIVQNTRQR